jgi:hypothetical protein
MRRKPLELHAEAERDYVNAFELRFGYLQDGDGDLSTARRRPSMLLQLTSKTQIIDPNCRPYWF